MASKIIVDQVQKSGGTAFTLPTSDGSNKSAVITDGSGALSFATGTPSASNFLRGDGTWATPDGGKILQIIQTLKTDTTTTTSASFVDMTGMTVSITPSVVTSKVLVFLNLNVNSGNLYIVNMRLLRDSTPVFIGDQANVNRARSTFLDRTNDHQSIQNYSGQFLDSPATTSAITYKMQWAQEAGSTARLNDGTMGSDVFKYGTTVSTITAMEVGA